MPQKITCPACSAAYAIADGVRIHAAKCKRCGTTLQVLAATLPAEGSTAATDTRFSAYKPPSALRGRRQRLLEKGKPFYTAPIFYVGVVATLLCCYLALTIG